MVVNSAEEHLQRSTFTGDDQSSTRFQRVHWKELWRNVWHFYVGRKVSRILEKRNEYVDLCKVRRTIRGRWQGEEAG